MNMPKKGLIGRIIGATILFTILAQVIHSLGAFLSMSYYTNPAYSQLWSKIMMPTAGPPPSQFYIFSIIFGLISAFLFTVVYELVKKCLLKDSKTKAGLLYGFILFLISTIPGSLAMYLLLAVPSSLILFWTFESLIILLFGGMVIAKIMK